MLQLSAELVLMPASCLAMSLLLMADPGRMDLKSRAGGISS